MLTKYLPMTILYNQNQLMSHRGSVQNNVKNSLLYTVQMLPMVINDGINWHLLKENKQTYPTVLNQIQMLSNVNITTDANMNDNFIHTLLK